MGVRELAQQAYERTLKLLTEKKELTQQLAERLLEKEVLLKEDVVSILGERPWDDDGAAAGSAVAPNGNDAGGFAICSSSSSAAALTRPWATDASWPSQ